MRNIDDITLIDRCIRGEKKAWDIFVERFSGLILWAITKRLGQTAIQYSQQDIQDIFQAVFLLLWEKRKLEQVRNRENISSWLVMVAANQTINYFRNRKEIPVSGNQSIVEPHFESNQSQGLGKEEAKNILENMLSHLSARENIILKLYYTHEKTHKEIAGILRIPTNTVSSIIKRAKDKLKKEYSDLDWEF